MRLYNIGKKAVIGRCERYNIPRIYDGRNVFYSRELIHKYFNDLKADYNREEWYSVEEMMEKFNMSYTAVISFVMRHHIPRIKDHDSKRYSPLYSKMHVDSKKGLLGDGTDPNLYTQEEIKEKYNLTKDQLSYILRTYNVERIKVGKLSKIPRKIFDDVMFKHRNGKTGGEAFPIILAITNVYTDGEPTPQSVVKEFGVPETPYREAKRRHEGVDAYKMNKKGEKKGIVPKPVPEETLEKIREEIRNRLSEKSGKRANINSG
jgi:hypothetical protein